MQLPPPSESGAFLQNLTKAEMQQSKEAVTLGHVLLRMHKINGARAQMLTDAVQRDGA